MFELWKQFHHICFFLNFFGCRWGGCMVALVPEGEAQTYIDYLKENYYKELPSVVNRDLDEVVFPTQPAAGAAIITL